MGHTLSMWQTVAALGVVVAAVVFGGAFAVDLGSERPDPVPFDQTVQRGMTMADEQRALSRDISVPRVQVFYSQYRYVVGYEGLDRAVTALTESGHEQQFGYPLAVYVSDYSGVEGRCSDRGTLRIEGTPGWVAASDAHFVVGGAARGPSGPVTVPFGSRDDADAFVKRCGGRVVDWATLRNRSFERDASTAVRASVDDRRARANATVRAARERSARPVSVVVGKDAPTVQGAVDAAPPNTTVVVPAGTYRERVTVEKPITLRGRGATLDGGDNGSVVTVRADRVGLVGFDLRGVGNRTVGNRSAAGDAWDATVTAAYGNSDAAVTAHNASSLYAADLSVRTPSSGLVLRQTPDAVVENVTVNGTGHWQDGFMSVVGMHGDIVVQNSRFRGGRDGVYLHRADGTVIRDNAFHGGRFGVHLMYTSSTLVADNTARSQLYSGVVVMTNPERNAVVGNDIRHSGSGIMMAGSRSYVARNVIANTSRGLSTNAGRSRYEHNVIYGNKIGLSAATVLPSNDVVANDFVANGKHAVSGPGPLRRYTHDGRGNYWSGAYDLATGDRATLTQPYSPTDTVDRRLHETDAAVVLRSAPSVRALRSLRGTTPGFRRGSIVDTHPLAEPANPDTLAMLRNETTTERAT
ncbi:NosD domain-containing protein [Haloarcula sediminis]|uniref:NosD domain-containing protein n=1 Tax=Haloarcula sediminis TaxID=3111777 RepID=UPI002D797FB7|nr:NosD domain-containing protein [Haloarcula sp. CK38]